MSSQQINLSLGTMESLLEVFFNYGIVHVYKVGCNGVWRGAVVLCGSVCPGNTNKKPLKTVLEMKVHTCSQF